jgi:PBSX family phage terminase large subunit
VRIAVSPTQAQDNFIRCPDRFTAFIGGIGSGKSWAGAVKALIRSAAEPSVGLVIAPTYPMLRDATWRSYQEICGDAITSYNRSEFTARIGNAEVLFRSADNPDRLRGPNIDWAHIDEAALCPPDTWNVVIGRLRGHGKAGPCWITSTPKGRNWLYAILPQLTLFRAHTRDNTHLAPEFITSLEAAYTGLFARQELEGEFVGFEGLVYEEFSREVHVQERQGPWAQVILGCDEGYTNPAVILVVGIDSDGRAHVITEFYRRRALQAEVIAEAKRLAFESRADYLFVDPSAAGLIADMQFAGLAANPAPNAVLDGIQVVKAALAVQGDGRPRLTVSPSCANLIAEFESYCWRESKGGLRDEPTKENDHAMDALRYALVGAIPEDTPPEGTYVYDERVAISPY